MPRRPVGGPANTNRAQALAWLREVLTEAGRFYLDHGRYPEPPKPEPAETIDPPEGTGGLRHPGRPRNIPDQPGSIPDLARIAQDDARFKVPAPVSPSGCG